MNLVQYECFDKLGFDDWCDQLDCGFVWKNYGFFWCGLDIFGEMYFGQLFQEFVGKLVQVMQVMQILFVELKCFEEFDYIGQFGGYDVGFVRWKFVEEYFENCCV